MEAINVVGQMNMLGGVLMYLMCVPFGTLVIVGIAKLLLGR